MKKRLLSALRGFDKLSLRERLLVGFACLALVGLAFYLVLTPWEKQRTSLNQQITSQQASLGKLETEVTGLNGQLQTREGDLHARSVALEQALASQETEFAVLQSRLMAPKDMPGLLQGVLKQRTGLKLVSLHSLAPKPLSEGEVGTKASPPPPTTQPANPASSANPAIVATPGQAAATPAPAVANAKTYYRHGLEVVVEGSYADLMAYVEDIEHLPQKLLWQQLRFQVDASGRVRLGFSVATLSEESTWLQL